MSLSDSDFKPNELKKIKLNDNPYAQVSKNFKFKVCDVDPLLEVTKTFQNKVGVKESLEKRMDCKFESWSEAGLMVPDVGYHALLLTV